MANIYKATRYQQGLCVNCRSPRDSTRRLCLVCRKKQAEYAFNLRKKRIAEGNCGSCGGTAETTSAIPSCLDCWFKHQSLLATASKKNAPQLRHLFGLQGGKCAYSGEPLLPGTNACLDHKTPRSRGGSDLIENLHWISKSVNRIKGTMTHEEFVSLCILVVRKHTTLLKSVGIQPLEAAGL